MQDNKPKQKVEKIRHYRINPKKIGKGAFSTVYKGKVYFTIALNELTNETVAIKKIKR